MLRLILIFTGIRVIHSLNNGLAIKPPMGWSSWHAYGCRSCTNMLDSQCLTEMSIRDIVNILVDEGFSKLGYEFILLDDGWQNSYRDGLFLQPDSQRFPGGMSTLASYIHNKSMKFAIFSDLGPTTGCGFPGSAEHFKEDANIFAQWGVDYVKMSGFTANPYAMDVEYPVFGYYLNQTNKPMVYATSWPIFQQNFDPYMQVNYWSVAAYCNTWRFAGDILPNWNIILEIMDTYTFRQDQLSKVVKPGAWNDADLLVVGVNGVTLDQCKAQMAVWSIIPSPLLFSTHPKNLTLDQKALLKNESIIAINQDSLGLPGRRHGQESNIDTWKRPISPNFNGLYSYAIAFVNRNEFGIAIDYTVTLFKLGLTHVPGYYVTDLFPSSTSIYNRTPMTPNSVLRMTINPSGVAFFKAEIMTNQSIYLPFLPLSTNGNVRY